jgi:hypothetical protein
VYLRTRTIATPAAYAIGALSLGYAAVYLGAVRPTQGANTTAVILSDLFILASGLLVPIVAATVGDRIGGTEGTWVKLVGVGWALLSATHGAFALAADLGEVSVPQISSTDPRGFATFGLAGLWTMVVGWLARQGRGGLPRGLGALGIVAGTDLVLLYLATLVGSETFILVFGGLASVVLGPIFWLWTGSALRR